MRIRHVALSATLVLGASAWPAALASSSQQAQPPAASQPAADRVTVPLSDPSQPALVTVSLVHGSITVRDANRKDVLVTARPEPDRPRRRVDRYRVSRNRSVVGATNGGGPEFELRTFNSNVYVRRGK